MKFSRSVAQLARMAAKEMAATQKLRAKGMPVLPDNSYAGAIVLATFLGMVAGYFFGYIAGFAVFAILIVASVAVEKESTEKQYQGALEVIRSHAKELAVRRAQLTIRKNYGLTDESKWSTEVDMFIGTVIRMQVSDVSLKNYGRVREAIWEVTAGYESITPSFSHDMNPLAYEQLVASTLREHGWIAHTTAGSGDQGIDVLATFGSQKIVIQCKLYSKAVGNAAVQEVIAGKTFERAHHAAVVSNADFTRSARQLASSSGVLLLHHEQLPTLADMCGINTVLDVRAQPGRL